MPVVKVDIESFGPQAERYTDCSLNITGADIVFEYRWHRVLYTYRGYETPDAPGRYELTCPEISGRLTLYKLPGTDRMMGRWSEKDSGYGLWEIDPSE